MPLDNGDQLHRFMNLFILESNRVHGEVIPIVFIVQSMYGEAMATLIRSVSTIDKKTGKPLLRVCVVKTPGITNSQEQQDYLMDIASVTGECT